MFDIKALQFLGFPLGALIWVVVLVFFGLSTMKARVLPKYAGVVLILLEPVLDAHRRACCQPITPPLADRGAYSGATEKGRVHRHACLRAVPPRTNATAARPDEVGR